MAAATASRRSRPQELESCHMREYPMAAATTIYQNTIVAQDSNGDAINAVNSGTVLLGVADEMQANAGAAGDIMIRVRWRTLEDFVLTYEKTNNGKKVYPTDNQTVTTTAGSLKAIGVQSGSSEGNIATQSQIEIIPQAFAS